MVLIYKKVQAALIVCLVLLSVLSLGNITQRMNAENKNQTVDMALDFKNLYLNTDNYDVIDDKAAFYQELKDKGISSIGLTENNLYELEMRDLIKVFKGQEILNSLWATEVSHQFKEDYTYIVVHDEDKKRDVYETIVESNIGNVFVVKEAEEKMIIEVQEKYQNIYREPLLYLSSDIVELSKYFAINLRVSNNWGERITLLENQITSMNEMISIKNVIFSGSEVESWNDGSIHNDYWKHFNIGMIEIFNAKDKQQGIEHYAKHSNYHVFRLHSLSAEKIQESAPIDLERLVVKAANERNIRMFYINMPNFNLSDEEGRLLLINEFFNKIDHIHLALEKEGYSITGVELFETPVINTLNLICSMLGAFLLFLLLAMPIIKTMLKWKNKAITIALWMMTAATALFMVVSYNEKLIQQITSLGLTIIVPILLSMFVYQYLESEKDKRISSWMFGLQLVGIFIAGLVFLISLNSGIEKILYVEGFKGVSLTLTVPVIMILLFILVKMNKQIQFKSFFNQSIRIKDVFILGVLGIGFMYYISRSGNGGTMLPLEGSMRNFLDDKLSVRPRTKEIFIGFPLSTVMFVYWNQLKYTKYLLPIFTLTIASVFNTFSHFHTPIAISVLRTILSLGIGLQIGLLICILIRTIMEVRKQFRISK